MLRPALLGLLAMMLTHAAAVPIVELRQDGACTVTIGSCNGEDIELVLRECACTCLQASCEEVWPLPCQPELRDMMLMRVQVGGCDYEEGMPFKGDIMGVTFQNCVTVSALPLPVIERRR